ncbi:hypothetical protein C4K68_05030 [Pokkaliibacter plantistimulans]|uniref:Sulfotransferase domain-containing protein n=1 Tax=Proteobacteria bacterium 228 TaxID=2083153 RepID=A0A2S5KUI3_9PROT|nr:sulfotransferase [Pokkaliibacter plantistimulans]PPC78420.1 hypothetical protein C4K68_05030 [Pokkaliibacter plantistimulans]
MTDLIHIGLPKTASTSLQNFWKSNSNIDCYWNELSSLVNFVRSNVGSHQVGDFDLRKALKHEHKKNRVFTSEAFSTYVWGAGATVDDVVRARFEFARAFYEVIPSAKILLFVRSPIDWIFSVYKQYIQEGGDRTLQNYLSYDHDFIHASLSIRNLVSIWGRFFNVDNIIIAPYELLVSDPRRLKSELLKRYGEGVAEFIPDEMSWHNRSITDKELMLMRDVSRCFGVFEKYAEVSKLSIKNIKKDFLLHLRTELQRSGKVCDVIARCNNEPVFKINLSQELIALIKNDFLDFLDEYDVGFFGMSASYKSTLGM